jgi:hypothetical protein
LRARLLALAGQVLRNDKSSRRMRYRSSSRLSYRNVLIAAGLAVGLGVGSASAKAGATSAPQPRSDGQSPNAQTPNAAADRPATIAGASRR